MYIVKSSLLLFSVTVIGFISRQITALECRDYPDPSSPKYTVSNCDIVKNENYDKLTADSSGFLSPADAFVIDFFCGSSDTTLCAKAKNVFILAGQRIASVIQFNTPIRVNASFTELGATILGSAGPARTIPLQDNDGVTRLYPQALVKQMQFPAHPEFIKYDIIALFSSTADIYFNSNSTIQKDQYDFEYIVTHEYIHGLGFVSGWIDYFEIHALIPSPEFLIDVDLDKPVTYTGFSETAFDGYITLSDTNATKMTTLAKRINQFASIGTKFSSGYALLNEFEASSQYQLASNLYIIAVTPYIMSFVTNDSTHVVLETKIAYNPGSSISHVDTGYMNTSDFLMAYQAQSGITFDDIIKENGNSSGGALGPNLIKVLETLGYATPNNPLPYRPTLAKSSAAININSLSMSISLIIIITLSQYFNIFI